jgi:hypothetical protein
MRPIVINQHYIPKSYLKNFGFLVNAKKKRWSLYAMTNGGEIERRTTENICSVDYLYDLPLLEGEERQFLEHAYEEHADRHFSEITKFIKEDSNLVLPDEMRIKMLKSCLSLYYRTPKFVELDQQALKQIELLPEEEREFAWKEMKSKLLYESVYSFEKLYNEKKDCGICINKAVKDWEFISGDNPVIIRNKNGVLIDALSDDNMIHVPITPRYLLTLMPSSETSLNKTFYRTLYDDDMVMGINHDIEKLHEKYLLGTEKSLQNYLTESPQYKAPATLNHPKVVSIRERAAAIEHLLNILMKNNGIITLEMKQYFDFYWQNIESFRDDPNSQVLKKQIEEMFK